METKGLITTILAILGFAFGLWKHFESRRTKQKLIDRESFQNILIITGQFIGELDQIMLARPIDSLIETAKAREVSQIEFDKTQEEMRKINEMLIQDHSEISRMADLLDSKGLAEHQIEEYRKQLDSVSKKFSEHQDAFSEVRECAEKRLESMNELFCDPFSEPMFKELKIVFDKFIFDLEKNPDWKLLSDRKASFLVMEIISEAQTLRSEVGKALYKSDYEIGHDKANLVLTFRGKLYRFQSNLQKY